MSQRNLFYELPKELRHQILEMRPEPYTYFKGLPNELQRKIETFRPRHPVAQIAAANIRPYNVSTGGFTFGHTFPPPYKPWGHYPSDRLKHHYLPGEGLIYEDDTLVTEGMRGVGM